jgi:hypothetical protein
MSGASIGASERRRCTRRRLAAFISRAAADELHVRRMDFQRVTRFAIDDQSTPRPAIAFDINRPSAREILRSCLSLASQSVTRNQVVTSLFFSGAAIFSAFVGGEAETANGSSLRRVTQLGSRPRFPTRMILLKDIVSLRESAALKGS